jgi:hypothetical protein
MGNYYALELFSGVKRQIFLSEKGLPPSELLTVFRPCDRAYPSQVVLRMATTRTFLVTHTLFLFPD